MHSHFLSYPLSIQKMKIVAFSKRSKTKIPHRHSALEELQSLQKEESPPVIQ